MRIPFSPNNNPRVIIIQKLYGRFFNDDEKMIFQNIVLENLSKI